MDFVNNAVDCISRSVENVVDVDEAECGGCKYDFKNDIFGNYYAFLLGLDGVWMVFGVIFVLLKIDYI